MKRIGPVAVTVGIVLALSSVALAGIELDEEPVIVGQEVTVIGRSKNDQPASDAPVKVTYFPNSEIKRSVEVGRTDSDGRLAWTPEHAGLSTIAADDQSLNVAVRFDGIPAGALVVFFIAGTLLFGGISLGVSKLR